MKKADVKLILAAAVLCLVLFGVRVWLWPQTGMSTSESDPNAPKMRVVVQVRGEEYGVYSLAEDQEIAIGQTNHLTIADGQAWMSEADCPDHTCMNQGKISGNGEMIVCLPNRVTVQILSPDGADASSEEEGTVDVIAG